MLSTFHQPPSALMMSPFVDFHWPVRSLWPETRPLFYQLEQEMVRHFQLMKQNMDYMERLHQRIWEEIDQSVPAPASWKPITFQVKKDQGGTFALTLNTQDYTPEELSVKQVGKKLRVSGRSEKKQEADSHSSYRLHEFRQEFDLPHGVSPESVTCSLDGGLLCIQAPCEKDVAGSSERLVPITLAPREQLGSTAATPETTTAAGKETSSTPSKTPAAGERRVPITLTQPEDLESTTPSQDKTETK